METPRHLESWHSYTYGGGSTVQNVSEHIPQLKSLRGVFKITNARKSSSTEDEFDFFKWKLLRDKSGKGSQIILV